MSVRFVPMTPELFGMIPLGDAALPEYHVARSADAQRIVCAAPNVALAMLDGGMVLGAAGVAQVWPGRGYAWLVGGAWMTRRDFVLAAYRCRDELAQLQAAGMWRVECTADSARPAYGHFVERLGFTLEGTMRGYGPDGSDHDLWALLPATMRERRSLVERLAA
jgi:hypothetical protein